MRRIPEAELMEGAAQAQAYAEADFSEANGLFVEHFRRACTEALSGDLLDLGCGPADIVCRLAGFYPDLHIDAVDASAAMLAWAERRIAAAGLQQRIALWRRYLPADAMPLPAYDAIVSNSLLHHLRDPADFWRTLRAYAKPGARLLVMDLLRPASIAQARVLVARYAHTAPPILRDDFYHSLLAAYRPEEVVAQLRSAGLERLGVEVVSDRHWLVSGRLD